MIQAPVILGLKTKISDSRKSVGWRALFWVMEPSSPSGAIEYEFGKVNLCKKLKQIINWNKSDVILSSLPPACLGVSLHLIDPATCPLFGLTAS